MNKKKKTWQETRQIVSNLHFNSASPPEHIGGRVEWKKLPTDSEKAPSESGSGGGDHLPLPVRGLGGQERDSKKYEDISDGMPANSKNGIHILELYIEQNGEICIQKQ